MTSTDLESLKNIQKMDTDMLENDPKLTYHKQRAFLGALHRALPDDESIKTFQAHFNEAGNFSNKEYWKSCTRGEHLDAQRDPTFVSLCTADLRSQAVNDAEEYLTSLIWSSEHHGLETYKERIGTIGAPTESQVGSSGE